MTDLKKLAALTALNNMMAGNYFDICTIDKVADLLGIPRGGESYKTLSALHCIHYAKMPKELRDAIPELIEEVLGVAPAYQFATLTSGVIDVRPVPAAPQRSGFLRLLGAK